MKKKEKQNYFIRTLMEGKRELSEREIYERCSSVGIDFFEPPFIVSSISPDYSSISFSEIDDLLYDFENYIRKDLLNHGFQSYLITNTYNNIQVLMLKITDEGIVDSYFRELHDRIICEYALESFIGIGSQVYMADKIFLSASESQRMLGYKYQYANQGVVNVSSFVEFEYNSMFGADIVFERVIGCFLDGNIEKMAFRLNELVEHVRTRPNVSRSSIRRTLIELTVRIVNIASNANIDVDTILGDIDIYHWIMEQGHTEKITEWILKLSSELITIQNTMFLNDQNKAISKACIFIERNLDSNELSLGKVSEYVGLSSVYFSQLFKEKKNIGINAYIVQRRMSRAKILLEKSELKIEDISLQVGYTRTQYFSKSFKEQEGITPSQYRQNHKKM